jgi:hypothetical protein
VSGSSSARRRALTWLRRVPGLGTVLVTVADLVLVRWQAGPPTGLKAGRFVAAREADDLPVTLVVLHQADPETAAETVRVMTELQLLVGGFRPVFLVEQPVFPPIRRAGYAVEQLVPRAGWEKGLPADAWGDYVAGRIAECRAAYDPDVTVIIPVGAAVDRDLLAALVGPAARRRRSRAVTAVRRRYRRLLRWLDKPS